MREEFQQRVVSKEIRESMIWIGIIQLINSAAIFHKEIEDANTALLSLNSPISSLQMASEKEFKSKVLDGNEGVIEVEHIGLKEDEGVELEKLKNNIKMDISPAAFHFARLFSPPLSTSLSPLASTTVPILIPSPPSSLRFTVVLGGNVRTDKFRALDHLIDTVRTPVQVIRKLRSVLTYGSYSLCQRI